MPRMDGYETAKRIQELAFHKKTPIVMVTGVTERGPWRRDLRRAWWSSCISRSTPPCSVPPFKALLEDPQNSC